MDILFFAGLIRWQNQHKSSGVEGDQDQKLRVYDIPFISPWLRRCGTYNFLSEFAELT